MKKVIIGTLCMLMVVTTMAQSKKEKAVASAVEQLKLAMESGNRADLEKITSEQLSYGHSGGHVENKAEFVENLASGNGDFVKIELSEQTISVHGKTAIVRHNLNATTNDKGKGPAEVHLKILLVFVHEKDGWKMLARQAVKNVK